MNVLLIAHWWLRWLILLVALIAVIKFLLGWLRNSVYQSMDRGLMSSFSGLMDLQAAIDILYLLWSGFAGVGFPFYRIGHGLIMIMAASVAHMSARWKNTEESIRFRNTLFLIIGSLVLVVIGIMVLPGGLSHE